MEISVLLWTSYRSVGCRSDPAARHLFERSPDLAVEVRSGDRQHYGVIIVTNRGTTPVLIKDVQVNNRSEAECSYNSSKTLEQGGEAMVGSSLMILGYCGAIINVRVNTDQGTFSYTIPW